MRLLHTSDWHLGRTFHGADLLADQESVLDRLVEITASEGVDAVLVAGDIYDRAVPSAETVRVATRALERIRRAGAELIITSGNHDSAARLGAFSGFAAAGGLHLRTTIEELAEPVLLPWDDAATGGVAVYGIPYLEPEPVRHLLGIDERGHTAVLGEAMRRIRADLASREGTRGVVLAHAFVTGADASGSERTIAVGGVEQVPASVFDGVDYVALGHLHSPQRVTETVRYSGSPLAYSFAERADRKSVWLVDLEHGGVTGVRRYELPVPRALATVTGTLEELLSGEQYAGLEECYVAATLTDPVRPLEAMRKLRERFPYAVHLEWLPDGDSGRVPLRYAEAVRGRTDRQITGGFLADCRGAEPTGTEQAWLDEALAWAGTAERPGHAGDGGDAE
ncbi:exonuclease SbcCD subunit D [Haloechinothrix sp. LS1_15]|uniref:exonuclease SbcCD subunit D n=1 Tax=Haloechinothrix sp. LS1_15 TaxID=2652248 RepID=UPI0029467698|nr:exonuclease SbcCD subunit D [Haloechinothrix sp. LS1_15]MDV6011541.1 exonuclease SbcCD subunit D [Haloechinothrix sp. LS1_15]